MERERNGYEGESSALSLTVQETITARETFKTELLLVRNTTAVRVIVRKSQISYYNNGKILTFT